jgi:hypothetical protein
MLKAVGSTKDQQHLHSRELAVLLAQTAWGETVIQPALVKLRGMFDQAAIKRMIDSQLLDEERHERLYWKAIRQLDADFPQEAMPFYYRQLQALVESADSPLKLIASLHVCLESFAMGAFEYRRSACNDPRILAMDVEVELDEIRHLNFAPIMAECLHDDPTKNSRSELFQVVREVHHMFLHDNIVEQIQKRAQVNFMVEEESLQSYRAACDRIWLQQFKQLLRVAM